MFKSMNFYPGVIKYNPYHIDDETWLHKENDVLQEDMFLVEYPNGHVMDVGWYSGVRCFLIYVVKDYDWDNPVVKQKVYSYSDLEAAVRTLAVRLGSLSK